MSIKWDLIPNNFFTRSEFDDPLYPGSGDLISGSLLVQLVKLRKATFYENKDIGWPMIIHSSVGGAVDVDGKHGHAENSFHLLKNGCKAVDFHFVTDVSLREQYFLVSMVGFGGIGVYPDWNTKGFHVDIRPKSQTQRWTCIGGKYIYLL